VRQCIKKELYSYEDSDMVFPVAHYHYRADYEPLKNTRESYFLDIRNILNGYSNNCNNEYARYDHYGRYINKLEEDVQDNFIKQYQIIKNGEIKYIARDRNIFNWLEDKDIRKVVKEWKGEPFDVLYYLSRHRYIERSVIRYHRMEVVAK
jgi:hypothetical protein